MTKAASEHKGAKQEMKQTQNPKPRTKNSGGKNLTKKEITNRVHTKTGLPRQTVYEMVTSIFDAFKGELLKGSTVKIANFGTWKIRSKRSRPGRNMKTGETMEISARSVVSFKPSQKLRDILNDK